MLLQAIIAISITTTLALSASSMINHLQNGIKSSSDRVEGLELGRLLSQVLSDRQFCSEALAGQSLQNGTRLSLNNLEGFRGLRAGARFQGLQIEDLTLEGVEPISSAQPRKKIARIVLAIRKDAGQIGARITRTQIPITLQENPNQLNSILSCGAGDMTSNFKTRTVLIDRFSLLPCVPGSLVNATEYCAHPPMLPTGVINRDLLSRGIPPIFSLPNRANFTIPANKCTQGVQVDVSLGGRFEARGGENAKFTAQTLLNNAPIPANSYGVFGYPDGACGTPYQIDGSIVGIYACRNGSSGHGYFTSQERNHSYMISNVATLSNPISLRVNLEYRIFAPMFADLRVTCFGDDPNIIF